MNAEFLEFLMICKDSIAKGEVKASKELTDYDLAVQFAIGKIGERKGYPCNITIDEIGNEIATFAPEFIEGK